MLGKQIQSCLLKSQDSLGHYSNWTSCWNWRWSGPHFHPEDHLRSSVLKSQNPFLSIKSIHMLRGPLPRFSSPRTSTEHSRVRLLGMCVDAKEYYFFYFRPFLNTNLPFYIAHLFEGFIFPVLIVFPTDSEWLNILKGRRCFRFISSRHEKSYLSIKKITYLRLNLVFC